MKRNKYSAGAVKHSLWFMEFAEDVEKCVGQLRRSLLAELDVNDIINVEF